MLQMAINYSRHYSIRIRRYLDNSVRCQCNLLRPKTISFHFIIISILIEMSTQNIYLRELSPCGHCPQAYEPGKLTHGTSGSLEQCGFSDSHSFISTVHAGVVPLVVQPWSQMHSYVFGSCECTQTPWPHISYADDCVQSTVRFVQCIPNQPGLQWHLQRKPKHKNA